MKHTRLASSILIQWALIALLAGSFGCSGGGNQSPTAPAQPTMVLQSASVSINGQDVTNGTWNHGGQSATHTRFEARLHRDGRPATGGFVYVDFERPQGKGRMHHQGRFQLYDDGTHGDHVPGDGLYCLDDFGSDYGFHYNDCVPGEYHYEYFGHDGHGYESNRVHVNVNVNH